MLIAVLVLALAATVAIYWYARPLLLTGTGYAAHSDCAVVHVAGRDDPASDLPPNPLVPYLRGRQSDDGASSTLLGVLSRQRAWYAEGFGCTLADRRPDLGNPPPSHSQEPHPFRTAPTPTPMPDSAVAIAVGRAFGDHLSDAERSVLGTRAIVVVKDGTIVAERYADGFDADTRQLGWSMSKSVTNLVAGRLVAQGRLALDDSRLRPEWTDARANITVADLLRMTSGLAWDETYNLGTPVTRMLYRESDMAAYAASQPLAHDAGTYQQYSSGSTNILCAVMRERSGLGPTMPHDLLFGELGLTSTVWEPDATGTPVCSSYLWATPRDWAATGQFALDGGRWRGRDLLPPDWMAESTSPVRVAGEESGYGAGWNVNRLPDGALRSQRLPADAYWAAGHDGQRMYVVPSAGLVVVRLGFTQEDPVTDQLVADLAR
jgi:CubicO group peptidase (beta-lactamase class C family)